MRIRLLLCLGVLMLGGCAQLQLRPAPEAQRVPGQRLAAAAENAGVRMVVQPQAWRGRPRSLGQELTPLKVTLENRSDRPVRINYEDFVLDTGGTEYTPLPPVDIKGEVTEYADRPLYVPRYTIVPRFGYRGFYVMPWYRPYYPGLRPWRTPWPYSSLYYDTYYPRWTVQLPTEDMLDMAIPEGVVEPGGSVTGYMYFPALDRGAERVTFRANLSVPRDGDSVASLSIPFEVG